MPKKTNDDIEERFRLSDIAALNNLVSDSDKLMAINTAFIDGEAEVAKELALSMPGLKYTPAGERIIHPGRMSIGFLVRCCESLEKLRIVADMCEVLQAAGHEALIISHARFPVKTKTRQMVISESTEIFLAAPPLDALIACSWSLAAQAMRMRAAVKMMLADYSLMSAAEMEFEESMALQRAYSLPVTIISFSDMAASIANRFFGRKVMALSPSVVQSRSETGDKNCILIAATGPRPAMLPLALEVLSPLAKEHGREIICAVSNGLDDSLYPKDIGAYIFKDAKKLLPYLKRAELYIDLSNDDCLSYQLINALSCGCLALVPSSGCALALEDRENCLKFDRFYPYSLKDAAAFALSGSAQPAAIAENGRLFAGNSFESSVAKLQSVLKGGFLQASVP